MDGSFSAAVAFPARAKEIAVALGHLNSSIFDYHWNGQFSKSD